MVPAMISNCRKRRVSPVVEKNSSENHSPDIKRVKYNHKPANNVLKNIDINKLATNGRTLHHLHAQQPEAKLKVEKPRRRKVTGNSVIKYKDGIPIFVVDEHDGSMVVTLRAIELGHCPEKFNFLHFDSHPDLGCITEENQQELVDECYIGNPSIRRLYKTTDIATWIIPMVLMGHTDYVVWACAHWCNQFNTGKWKLLCGKDRSDGKMKVGTRGNKRYACLEYWASGDSVCKEENFEFYRDWTLEVIKFNKRGKLPEKQIQSVREAFAEGPWVLDVDEDFFSCNNPYRDEFSDLFGAQMYDCLEVIYDWTDQTEGKDTIKQIYKQKLYNNRWQVFSKHELVKNLMDNMQCDEDIVEQNIRKFHRFLRRNWPNGGYEDSEEEDEEEKEEKDLEEEEGDGEDVEHEEMDELDIEIAAIRELAEDGELEDQEEEDEEWHVPHFFPLSSLHTAGSLSCLPHHISTADQIKTLANQVEGLLALLPDPVLITLATSRLDRYLPDSQAVVIHGLCEDLLKVLYDTENIQRYDKPKFSVDNIPTEDIGKIEAREILDICESESEEVKR